MVNWLPDVFEVDRPGSSSASIAGLLTAKTGGGVARSGIGCWVAAAMGRPCRSRAISILRRMGHSVFGEKLGGNIKKTFKKFQKYLAKDFQK